MSATPPTLLEIALGYIDRGWAPVPVGYRQKGPRLKGWEDLRITAADAPHHFNGKRANVGVILGPPSHGLADVDLDTPDAVACAPYFLPPDTAVFGRDSKRDSHWLYVVEDVPPDLAAALSFNDPISKAHIVELRLGVGRGAQTVFPGSTHPSGEAISWKINRDPLTLPFQEIHGRVSSLAAASLLRHYWPPEPGGGLRHDAALALGGVLGRAGWDTARIKNFTEAVVGPRTDHPATAADSAKKVREGGHAFGRPALAEILGERGDKIVAKVVEWLDLRMAETGSSTGARSSARSNGAAGPDPHAGVEGEVELERGKNGPLNTVRNVLTLLRRDPHLRDCMRLDLMSGTVFLLHPLPGRYQGPPTPRPMVDADVTWIQDYLQSLGLRSLGQEPLFQALAARARECSFHPIRDMLDALQWDGRERLPTWLAIYLGAELTPYTEGIGPKILIALVRRVYEPGCKQDYLGVLIGPQGIRKSTAARILVGDQWFSDNLPDIRSKDASIHLRGKWLIEISELNVFRKTDARALKSFISRQVEKYRPPYGRNEVEEGRQCIFLGSTNEDEFIDDPTGGRRFWPIRCGLIDLDALARDREQLLAEAVHRYRQGETSWPDDALEALAAVEQERHYDHDPWEDDIGTWLGGHEELGSVRVGDLAREALGIHDKIHANSNVLARIKNALRRLGWQRRPSKDADGNWLYDRPPPEGALW